MFRVSKGVQNLDWLHPFLDQREGPIQSLGVRHRLNRRQDRFAFFESQITIIWKALVCCSPPFFQLIAKLRNKRFELCGDTGLLTIGGQLSLHLLPRQQLETIIPELVAPGNAQVPGFEIIGDLNHDTQLQHPSIYL